MYNLIVCYFYLHDYMNEKVPYNVVGFKSSVSLMFHVCRCMLIFPGMVMKKGKMVNIHLEHTSSPMFFLVMLKFALALVFCAVSCRPLFIPLLFSLSPLYVLFSFSLQHLITPVVPSDLYYAYILLIQSQ